MLNEERHVVMCTAQSWVAPWSYFPGMYLCLSYWEKVVVSNQIYVVIYIVSDNELRRQYPHPFSTFLRHVDGWIQRQLSKTPVRGIFKGLLFVVLQNL